MASASGNPRLCVDGYNLALEMGTGVATYARNLVAALKAMGAEVDGLYGQNIPAKDPPDRREVAFFDPPPPGRRKLPYYIKQELRAFAGQTATEVPITGAVIAEDFKGRLPAFDRIWNVQNLFSMAHLHFQLFGRFMTVRLPNPPEVMHWTYPVPIEMAGAKNVYTLHDLVPLRLPHTTLDRKDRYRAMVGRIAERADHIVTVSEASKRDIVELLGAPESKVTNTYQWAELPKALTGRSEAQVRAELEGVLNLPFRGFFLFLGAIEPKKNIDRLLQGFLATDVETPLVMVGKRAWKAGGHLWALDLIEKRLGDTSRVIHLDYVPFPLVVTLLQSAKALVFPSIYEGFGLPVLEALQLGTPVITSTTASLPEIAGEAALLVDPYDHTAIGEAFRRMDQDAALRERLAAAGPAQAETFAPARYQARLAELYGRLGVPLRA